MSPKKFARWYMVEGRRGRSTDRYNFAMQAPGPPILSKQPYAFVDALLHENQLVMRREDEDPVYRGEIRPEHSSAYLDAIKECANQEEEQDELDFPTPPSTPSPSRERHSAPVTPGLLPLSLSPTVSELASFHRFCLSAAKKAFEAAARSHRRKSARLNQARVSDNDMGVWTAEQLVRMGHILHDRDSDALTPVIDKRQYVMAVISGPPKGQSIWWGLNTQHATKIMESLRRNRDCCSLFPNEESRVHFGVGFGRHGAVPYRILQKSANFREIAFIQCSGAFAAILAYQNHKFTLGNLKLLTLDTYLQPTLDLDQRNKVEDLKKLTGIGTPFTNSVFTTSEISFGDAPDLSAKNLDATFYDMEAVTAYGSWANKEGLMLWDDDAVIPLRAGSTVLFPAGTKRFSFTAANPGEQRFFFRQFCNAEFGSAACELRLGPPPITPATAGLNSRSIDVPRKYTNRPEKGSGGIGQGGRSLVREIALLRSPLVAGVVSAFMLGLGIRDVAAASLRNVCNAAKGLPNSQILVISRTKIRRARSAAMACTSKGLDLSSARFLGAASGRATGGKSERCTWPCAGALCPSEPARAGFCEVDQRVEESKVGRDILELIRRLDGLPLRLQGRGLHSSSRKMGRESNSSRTKSTFQNTSWATTSTGTNETKQHTPKRGIVNFWPLRIGERSVRPYPLPLPLAVVTLSNFLVRTTVAVL
ncbi:hypothetical protein B0H17DRAFT_1140374 [Mycena rosella]|uniref:Uncharacterized protein n=1 Tax=Mycena rosella TaxID=1033263 RepID=A0AAD7D3M6_MYCRO|nr:hypothetical protein B0H17DRAFT_1140374 [Mycena rosella]